MPIFRRSRASPAPLLNVHLNARLQPMHRLQFEDPLEDLLARSFPSTRITGGGTLMSVDRRILSCDIELTLGDPAHDVMVGVARLLAAAGAPVGSFARFGTGDPLAFGDQEGLIVRLTPALQPEFLDNDVPLSAEFEGLMQRISTALGDAGIVRSWHMRDDDSEIFVYGPSASALRAVITHLDEDLLAHAEFEPFALRGAPQP